MPKDLKEEVRESKKKMVVVEEVAEVEEAKKEEISDESQAPKVVEVAEVSPVVTEVTVDEEEVEKSNYLWIIIPTALLIGALVGGLITYFSGISRLAELSPTSTPVPTSAPVVQPTPTTESKSTFDRSIVKIQVLNGSGISGLASKAKIYLEGLGYKEVATGNASVSNLVETKISAKDSKSEVLNNVISDVSKNYKVAEKTEVLAASSKYDFVIILGSK